MQTCSIYSMYIESYRDEVFMELANLDVSFSELDDVMKVCIVCVCVCVGVGVDVGVGVEERKELELRGVGPCHCVRPLKYPCTSSQP